jgi:putative nucleotidyltransferase with HDIG domain
MQEDLIHRAEEFVKNAFIENPHYSFGHWSVMYDHSVRVKDFVLKISEHVDCDKTLAAIGGLFHDIGKTQRADEETLHYDNEKFNLPITEKFIETLSLTQDEKNKLKSIVSYSGDLIEIKVIKDADALAFFADKKLNMLFLEWAVEKKLTPSIQRKLDKFKKLRFPFSIEMGRELFENMKKDWDAYLKEHKIKLDDQIAK